MKDKRVPHPESALSFSVLAERLPLDNHELSSDSQAKGHGPRTHPSQRFGFLGLGGGGLRWIRAAIQTQLNWLQKLRKKINGSLPKTVPLSVIKLNLQQNLGLPATTPMGRVFGDVEGQSGAAGQISQ